MRPPSRIPASAWVASLLLVASLATSPSARGDITQLTAFHSTFYHQTSGTLPPVNIGWYYDLRVNTANPTDFTSATLTYPGSGSPANIPPYSPGVFWYQPAGFTTQSNLNAAYPMGTYTVQATNSSTNASQTTSYNYTTDAYALAVPTITAASWAAIQSINPAAAATFGFSAYLTNANANEHDLFFSITNHSTNAVVYSQGFLPPTTTSLTVPAGTFASNTQYDFRLTYSERINGANGTVSTVQGFDLNDVGSFVTVPEPGVWSLVGVLGLAAVVARKRKRD